MNLSLFFSDLGLRHAALGVMLIAATSPVMAQYKVIGPDGRVTFTDRPANTPDTRVTPLRARGDAGATPLPATLQGVATRYPVTLYVVTSACEPCDAGRLLLRQRGIPFNERQILASEDVEALERLTNSRDTPALTIGSQALRGFTSDTWNAYLDAAGYPRESKLPSNYTYSAPQPLTASSTTRPQAVPEPVRRIDAPSLPMSESNPAGIRF